MLYEKDLRSLDNSASNIGVITKWYDDKNKVYIKASAYIKSKRVYHLEAIMECLAYDIGSTFGINMVPYWLDDLTLLSNKVILVCVSIDYQHYLSVRAVISARSLLLSRGFNLRNWGTRYKTLVSIYPSTRDSIDKMVLFDYLIDNHDRHLRNFEFLSRLDNVILLAPIFDSGSSLLSDWVNEEELLDLSGNEDLYNEHLVLAETQSKCFAHQHSTELNYISKESFHNLNTGLKESDFSTIVSKYSAYLSPLRLQMIYKLLVIRYGNLVRRFT